MFYYQNEIQANTSKANQSSPIDVDFNRDSLSPGLSIVEEGTIQVWEAGIPRQAVVYGIVPEVCYCLTW